MKSSPEKVMGHTEGKLTVAENGVFIVSEGNEVIAMVGDTPGEEQCADTRRFVACWNVCNGIKTESLEKSLSITEQPMLENAMYSELLEVENDNLLKALRDMSEQIERCDYVQARNDALAILSRPQMRLIKKK